MRFTVTVASASGVACSFVPTVALTITSGRDRVWTSSGCAVLGIGGPGVAADPTLGGSARAVLLPGGVALGPGASTTLALVWPGVRSVGSCAADSSPLRGGTYVAAVTLDGVGSADVVFPLH